MRRFVDHNSLFSYFATASIGIGLSCSLAWGQETPKAGPDDINVSLKAVASGAAKRLGGYIPLRISIVVPKPDNVKKVPDGLSPSARYGVLRIGAPDKPTDILVLVDAPDGKPARLWLDVNANGDFTDDPTVEWTAVPYKVRGASAGDKETTLTLHRATAQIPLAFGGVTTPVSVGFYQFDPEDSNRPTAKETLFYFRDWGLEGTATLGEAAHAVTVPIVLDDDHALGSYTDLTRLFVLLDINGDGRFTPRGERFRADKPFNIGGISYVAKSVDPVAGTLTLTRSDKKVEPILVPPPVLVGKPAPEFSAQAVDGETVEFPQGFRGKVVLLDFWATWSEPCVANAPNRVALYTTHHADGLAIVGVSLDRPESGAKLAAFTKAQKMEWPQIFDGKFWDAALAHLYGVEELPQAFLLDGDTGMVLAMGETLRGEQAAKTIEAALQAKKAAAQIKPDPVKTEPEKPRNEVKSVPPVVSPSKP